MAVFRFVAEETRGYLAALGVRSMDELIGRTDLLRADLPPQGRIESVDLSGLLADDPSAKRGPRHCVQASNPPRDAGALGQRLLDDLRSAIDNGSGAEVSYPIANHDRTVGDRKSTRLNSSH